jgi:hypothetical protein
VALADERGLFLTDTVVREFREVFDGHGDEKRGSCFFTTVLRRSACDDHCGEKGRFATVVRGRDVWCFWLGSDGYALTTVVGD